MTKQAKDNTAQCDDAVHGYTAKNHKRHFVQHDYHDHADDLNTETVQVEQLQAFELDHGALTGCGIRTAKDDVLPNKESKEGKQKGGVNVPFPEKLHQMLDKIEQDGFGSIISWQPHGRAFAVHKQKEFVDVIMPRYFRQSKISSFQRQLNLYGFCRLTRGRDKGAYYHELFLRGRIFLCRQMIRTRIKGTGIKASSSPDSEPNFYAMKPCFANLGSSLASIPWTVNISGVDVTGPSSSLVSQNILPQASNVIHSQTKALDLSSPQSPAAPSLTMEWSHIAMAQTASSPAGTSTSDGAIRDSSRVSPQLSIGCADQASSPLAELATEKDVFVCANSQTPPSLDKSKHVTLQVQSCSPESAPLPLAVDPVESFSVQVACNSSLSHLAKFGHEGAKDLHTNALSVLSDSLNGGSQITSRLLDPIILRRIQGNQSTSTSKSRSEISLDKPNTPAFSEEDRSVSRGHSLARRVSSDAEHKSETSVFAEEHCDLRSPRSRAKSLDITVLEDEVMLRRMPNSQNPAALITPNNIVDVVQDVSVDLVRTFDSSKYSRQEICRTLRHLSLMNLEDMSFQNLERLDEQAMDDFFTDFEDTEMSALLAAIRQHDNDDVLGDALDQLMDTL